MKTRISFIKKNTAIINEKERKPEKLIIKLQQMSYSYICFDIKNSGIQKCYKIGIMYN